MSEIIYRNSNGPVIPFGIVDPKPLINFPSGKVRIRMRNDEFVQAFVKTQDGIQRFYVEEVYGDYWQPSYLIGKNKTIKKT